MRAIAACAAPLAAALLTAAFVSPAAAQRGQDYWVGVMAVPIPQILQAHLDREDGVMIDEVVPDSPADKAGLRRYDVIIAVGGEEVADPRTLVEAVAKSEGKEIEMKIFRGGEETTVTVAPEERPEAQGPRRGRRFPGRDFERFLPRDDQDARRLFFFGPGMMMPDEAGPARPPEGSVTITREKDQPARIVYKKGDETWEATEDNLDELPEEARAYVRRLLDRGARFEMGPPGFGPRGLDLERLQRDMEELRRRFEEMQRQNAPRRGERDV